MQHPIGEHALLADSRTAALIDPDGNVAWLCWPWIDATPLLFSILDSERGGGFSLRPAPRDRRVLSRRYHPRSLVLETVWEVGSARLIVEEALDLGEGPLMVRRMRAEGDAVDVVATVSTPAWPGTRASLRILDHALELDGVSRVAIHAPSRWEATTGGATCEFTVQPGSARTVTLATANATPRATTLEPTLTEWRRRIPETPTHNRPSSGVRDLLGTTAAVLLGLRRKNGGIVAAPTTSLPQWPGSARTWDYRYSWLRDSSLAALAMLRLGLSGEARSLGIFIGSVVMDSGPVPLVRLDGSAPPDETDIAELAGYCGARPVRIGNAAAGQAQLDVPGEVIELATALAEASALPDELVSAVPILAAWLVEHLRDPDNGIWEIRGEPARYTHSLVAAVSGLQSAVALADQRLVSGDALVWRRAALAAATDLGASGALELRIDGGGADAALAQAALLGGVDAIAHRVDATLQLIAERLDRGGLVDRYEGQPDMIADPCAPFVFPTFWLARALEATGHDGSRWLEAALATAGPLGLFGEVADPVDHSPLGNYPQVQSHAAFVLAIAAPENSA
ncbi:MAG: glycoside hydrolase family 15 protein [Candidatus Dormiibacterota bacterium]